MGSCLFDTHTHTHAATYTQLDIVGVKDTCTHRTRSLSLCLSLSFSLSHRHLTHTHSLSHTQADAAQKRVRSLFSTQVSELVSGLHEILHDSVQINLHSADPEMMGDLYLRIARVCMCVCAVGECVSA